MQHHDDLAPRVCPYCEGKYIPKRPWQRFCCRAHREAFHANVARLAREAWRKLQGEENGQD